MEEGMEIGKRVYQSLDSKQRAVAIYAALNRGDGTEAARLLGEAPKGHGRAVLGLGQAFNAYNRLSAQIVRDALLTARKLEGAIAFLEGWIEGGGAPDDGRYREKMEAAELLAETALQTVGELQAVKQAAEEWCAQTGVPMQIFEPPLAYLSLTKDGAQEHGEVKADDATLELVRPIFNEIKI